MKYVKLFESFIKEELDVNTQKSAYDKMNSIAEDPSNIDNLWRGKQAKNIESMMSVPVKNSLEKLESIAASILIGLKDVRVEVSDEGLSTGFYCVWITYGEETGHENVIMSIHIYKDKYKNYDNLGDSAKHIQKDLLLDRSFTKTLQELISNIQKNEIFSPSTGNDDRTWLEGGKRNPEPGDWN
jgi:hypothetical protein